MKELENISRHQRLHGEQCSNQRKLCASVDYGIIKKGVFEIICTVAAKSAWTMADSFCNRVGKTIVSEGFRRQPKTIRLERARC